MENVVEKKTDLATIDQLPNLHEAKVSPRELSSEYWTPEEKGEYKVGVVIGIEESTYEEISLPCVIMLSQEKDGSFNTIRNGSVRLVGAIEDAVESGEVVFGKTPLKIEFVGKVKNKTNSYKSDKWSVKPILLG